MKFANVIKHDVDNGTFVWKYPDDNITSTSQLVVAETQEAIFFHNGEIVKVFGPGKYELSTENIPGLKAKFAGAFGTSPFACKIYFINKTEQLNIKWGTPSKFEYKDPTYHFPVQLGMSGTMSLRVVDSCKLLVKLVGTMPRLSQDAINAEFRSFLITKLKTYVPKRIKQDNISIFDIDEQLESLSEELLTILKKSFQEYGLDMVHFFITDVSKPEDNQAYKELKDLHYKKVTAIANAQLDKEVEIIKSQGRAAKRNIEGFTYMQERGFDVAGQAAANEGGGNMANLGVGLGIMSSMGNAVSGMMNNSLSGVMATGANQPTKQQRCHECGAVVSAGAKFCGECGAKQGHFCPYCGYSETPDANFCSNCGKRITDKPAKKSNTKQSGGKKR